jgi:hypothetical protein
MEVSSQCHGPAALLAEKEFLLLSEQQAGWAPEPVLTLWKKEKKKNSYLCQKSNHSRFLDCPAHIHIELKRYIYFNSH